MTRMFVLAVAFVVGMVFSTAGALGQCPTDNTPCAWKEGRTVNIGGQFYNPVTKQIETCSLRIYSCYRCCPSNGDVSFEITLSKVEFLNPDCAQKFYWKDPTGQDPEGRMAAENARAATWRGIDESMIFWGITKGRYPECNVNCLNGSFPQCDPSDPTSATKLIRYYKPSCYRRSPHQSILSNGSSDPLPTMEWCGTLSCTKIFSICCDGIVLKYMEVEPGPQGRELPCTDQNDKNPEGCFQTCF
jgi:hypothetical protein